MAKPGQNPKGASPKSPKNSGAAKRGKPFYKQQDIRMDSTLKAAKMLEKEGFKLKPRHLKRLAKTFKNFGADPNVVERQNTIRMLGSQAISEGLGGAAAGTVTNSKLIDNVTRTTEAGASNKQTSQEEDKEKENGSNGRYEV